MLWSSLHNKSWCHAIFRLRSSILTSCYAMTPHTVTLTYGSLFGGPHAVVFCQSRPCDSLWLTGICNFISHLYAFFLRTDKSDIVFYFCFCFGHFLLQAHLPPALLTSGIHPLFSSSAHKIELILQVELPLIPSAFKMAGYTPAQVCFWYFSVYVLSFLTFL